MSVEGYQPNLSDFATSIVVSDEVIAHFDKQLKKIGKKAVRLSLKQAGCTGYKYVIEEVDAPEKQDVLIEQAKPLLLYVDNSNALGLRGVKLGMRQQGFNWELVIENPNVKDACGCGESFNFNNEEKN